MPSQDVWRREQPAWRGLAGRVGLPLPALLTLPSGTQAPDPVRTELLWSPQCL